MSIYCTDGVDWDQGGGHLNADIRWQRVGRWVKRDQKNAYVILEWSLIMSSWSWIKNYYNSNKTCFISNILSKMIYRNLHIILFGFHLFFHMNLSPGSLFQINKSFTNFETLLFLTILLSSGSGHQMGSLCSHTTMWYS